MFINVPNIPQLISIVIEIPCTYSIYEDGEIQNPGLDETQKQQKERDEEQMTHLETKASTEHSNQGRRFSM